MAGSELSVRLSQRSNHISSSSSSSSGECVNLTDNVVMVVTCRLSCESEVDVGTERHSRTVSASNAVDF